MAGQDPSYAAASALECRIKSMLRCARIPSSGAARHLAPRPGPAQRAGRSGVREPMDRKLHAFTPQAGEGLNQPTTCPGDGRPLQCEYAHPRAKSSKSPLTRHSAADAASAASINNASTPARPHAPATPTRRHTPLTLLLQPPPSLCPLITPPCCRWYKTKKTSRTQPATGHCQCDAAFPGRCPRENVLI